MLGHRHATISLICMSTHKATAARCLSYHQAAYGQPAIWALAMAPLRRLALRVLFTIATNSYQTTCTVSKRTFNKRQHANARHGVDFSFPMHYDNLHLLCLLYLSSQYSLACELVSLQISYIALPVPVFVILLCFQFLS